MTIKVKFKNGVFEPVGPVKNLQIEEGSELEIRILPQEKKDKLKGIVGLFSDLSGEQIERFEKTAERRTLFELSEHND